MCALAMSSTRPSRRPSSQLNRQVPRPPCNQVHRDPFSVTTPPLRSCVDPLLRLWPGSTWAAHRLPKPEVLPPRTRGDPGQGNGAPGETRTRNPLLRRQTLYPTELRARYASDVKAFIAGSHDVDAPAKGRRSSATRAPACPQSKVGKGAFDRSVKTSEPRSDYERECWQR